VRTGAKEISPRRKCTTCDFFSLLSPPVSLFRNQTDIGHRILEVRGD
jgi:hypothetical protein